MTKTKAELRREAVERLRDCRYHTLADYIRAMLGWGHEPHFEDSRDALIDLLADDAHEARGSYEERLYDVPVSDCPYCGCKRVVIHDFSDIYEKPHSYRVEHIDEKEAFEAGCFETYYAFDSAEKAVEHANMRDLLTDEPMDAQRDSDGTCPIDDGTVSIERGDGVAKLDAQSRAEIEDMERSRAVSGDSGQDADVDSIEGEKAAQDTREKLEAAVHTAAGYIYGRGFTNGLADAWNDDEVDTAANQIIQLLDRQAAITQDETIHDYNIAARESGRILRDEIAELQVDRDELQKQLDTMRDVTREFRDERDEWKAKAKKRDFKDEMADLLFRIQIPLNVQREYLKKVSQDSEMDSREMLEAEIRYEYNGSISYEADQIIEWLDRQAAITRREVLCHPDERDEQIAELQAKVDDLKEELEDEKSENGWVRDFLNRMARKCGTKDCPSLVAYVGQLEAKNEQLREKLSRAYDNAHDTLRTM